MRVCIHRGSKEIGGSCVEMESEGKRLIIDFGLPLDSEGDTKRYLPKIAGLDGNDESLLGILVSHPHLDHFGLLSHASPTIKVGMGAAAKRIIKAAASFLPDKRMLSLDGWEFESKKCIKIGPFLVTPYLVDHSAYDSYALKIESNGKSIFYSGDFRAHGRKAALFEYFVDNPPKNIDALLMEGSTLGRLSSNQRFPTENDLENKMVKIFKQTKGLVLVHASGQNIDRIVTIYRASKRTNRKLVMDIYIAEILKATQNDNIPQSSWENINVYVPNSQCGTIYTNKMFEILKNHKKNRIYIEALQKNPEQFTILYRPLHNKDLKKANCLQGASFIYSQWEGYWEKGVFDNTKEWLERHGIEKQSVHTSGHASIDDLKRLLEALKPQKLIPIHSFMPEKYAELFENTEAHEDGEWWDVGFEP